MSDNNWFLDPEKFIENLTPHPRSDHEWDLHFMSIAAIISSLSKCASRNIGAILVKDKDIVSMGFNGSPKGSSLCQSKNNICPRKTLGFPSGQGLEVCPAQHAERNVIAQAAKKGKSTEGSTLYAACFTKDTMILCKTGQKHINEIIVGDEVLSSDGYFHKVLNTTKKLYTGDIKKITPKGLKDFVISPTADHIIFAKKSKICNKRIKHNNRSCFMCSQKNCNDYYADLIHYDEIRSDGLDINDWLYVPYLKDFKTRPSQSDIFKKVPIELFNDIEFPWIMGMYIAEGSIQYVQNKKYASGVSFSLHQKEVQYQNRIINFFNKYNITVKVYPKSDSQGCSVQVSSAEMGRLFESLCNTGSENKKIPEDFLYTECLLSIIQGIADGDGCAIKSQKTIKTTSELLKNQIVFSLAILGYAVRYSTEPAKIDKNNIPHKQCWCISYKDKTTNCQNRKGSFVKLGSIETISVVDEEVYDLTIDVNSSYTAGIVGVHNCGVPCQQCAGGLIQAGISRIVCYETYTNDSLRGAPTMGKRYDHMGEILLKEANVDIHEMDKKEILDYLQTMVVELLKR